MMNACRLAAVLPALVALAGCASEPPDPQRDAVRTYLREHLDDADFEEVRWWPAKPLPEYKAAYAENERRMIDEALDQGMLETDSFVINLKEGLGKRMAADPPPVARLTYRAKNKVGAKELRDEMFVFSDDGRVINVIAPEDDEPNQSLWSRRSILFPE